MKNFFLKLTMAICFTLIIFAGIKPLSALAATSSLRIVMGIGRSSAIVSDSSGVTIKPLEEAKKLSSLFCVPVIDDGTVYVPLRFIMETVGFTVEYTETQAVIMTPKSETMTVWDTDENENLSELTVSRIDYKDNIFELVGDNGEVIKSITIQPSKLYFGKTYIPIQELERFGFIVYMENNYNLLHIANGDSDNFLNLFKAVFKETDMAKKAEKAASYYPATGRSEEFNNIYKEYISFGTEYSNYANGSLAINLKEGLFLSIEEGSIGVAKGSKQLTYTAASNQKTIYYISEDNKNICKVPITGKNELGMPSIVVMPKELADKKFSHLIINYDRLFFIAYDNASEGGYVYMARIGDEANTATKLVKDRLWNIALTSDYKLYYMNYDKQLYLYSLDLKDMTNIGKLYEAQNDGLDGELVQEAEVLSIAFSQKHPSTYYYSDRASGKIMETRFLPEGRLAPKILAAPDSPDGLIYYINLDDSGEEEILYYIEYDNGKEGNFDSGKIKSYNMATREVKLLHNSSRPIRQLSIVGRDLYFRNEDATELYSLNLDTGLSSY